VEGIDVVIDGAVMAPYFRLQDAMSHQHWRLSAVLRHEYRHLSPCYLL
jgi:hypothetical protein